MRLCLINPSNPLVSMVNVSESRWNRYRIWKPLSLMVLAGLTPSEWEILIVDDNLIGTHPEHIARAKDLFRAMTLANLQKEWIAQATINLLAIFRSGATS